MFLLTNQRHNILSPTSDIRKVWNSIKISKQTNNPQNTMPLHLPLLSICHTYHIQRKLISLPNVFPVTASKLYSKLLRTRLCSMVCYVQLFIAFVGPRSERRRLLGLHDTHFGTQILTTHTCMLEFDVSSHIAAIWACMQITRMIMA